MIVYILRVFDRTVTVNTTGCCGGWQGPQCNQRKSFNLFYHALTALMIIAAI